MITDLIRTRDVLDEAITTASADPPASAVSRADTTRPHRGPA
ncbi:hypothetical protein ACIPXV_27805 [Streptomyces libani]